ncbi:head GIN domain-containing protein [Croceibacterium sp. TMG7-5b_MA50]|uniref:head GIN domain-containing protein n=1 Tax=Croceibacterium sp. TMG7-5b_MA50 TaxID=3121290 RepID=UPI003221D391
MRVTGSRSIRTGWIRGGVLVAVTAMLAACGVKVGAGNISTGVPLAEFDLDGTPPTGVALAGADTVLVTTGATFSVRAEGPATATERLRFNRTGDTLAIGREGDGPRGGPAAIVRVTLPNIRSLALSGSGDLSSDALSGEAELRLSGSGNLSAPQVTASRLKVALAGSGDIAAGGTAETLELGIAGSGSANMARLQVGAAEVRVSGSGDAAFASNGKVSGAIAGSGDVQVRGTAQCDVRRAGSGNLTCTP